MQYINNVSTTALYTIIFYLICIQQYYFFSTSMMYNFSPNFSELLQDLLQLLECLKNVHKLT